MVDVAGASEPWSLGFPGDEEDPWLASPAVCPFLLLYTSQVRPKPPPVATTEQAQLLLESEGLHRAGERGFGGSLECSCPGDSQDCSSQGKIPAF